MRSKKRRHTRRSIPASLRYKVLRRDQFRCIYCGARAGDEEMQVDHRVPVSKGGTNDLSNLVTACRRCNAGKGTGSADPPSEFPEFLITEFPGSDSEMAARVWLRYQIGLSHTPGAPPYIWDDPTDALRSWIVRVRENRLEPLPIIWDYNIEGWGSFGINPGADVTWLPSHPETGQPIPVGALPVEHDGLVYQTTHWRPHPRQQWVTLDEILAHVHRALATTHNLDLRIQLAAAEHAFRASGVQFEPFDPWGHDWPEDLYLDILAAAGDSIIT